MEGLLGLDNGLLDGLLNDGLLDGLRFSGWSVEGEA